MPTKYAKRLESFGEDICFVRVLRVFRGPSVRFSSFLDGNHPCHPSNLSRRSLGVGGSMVKTSVAAEPRWAIRGSMLRPSYIERDSAARCPCHPLYCFVGKCVLVVPMPMRRCCCWRWGRCGCWCCLRLDRTDIDATIRHPHKTRAALIHPQRWITPRRVPGYPMPADG